MQIKKSLLTAMAFVATLLAGTAALAQNVDTDGSDTPLVAPGNTVYFDNVYVGARPGDATSGDSLVANFNVVLLLPEGSNFSGTPTATVTSIGGTPSLRVSSNIAGDPGLEALIDFLDTNGDGGMDRAEVAVVDDGVAADGIVFSGAMVWNGSEPTVSPLTIGTDINVGMSVIDNTSDPAVFVVAGEPIAVARRVNTTFDTAPLAAGVAALSGLGSSNDVSTADSIDNDDAAGELLLTIPAGAGADEDTDGFAFTLPAGITLINGETSIDIEPLTDGAPALTISVPVSFVVDSTGGTLVGTVDDEASVASQYIIEITNGLAVDNDDATTGAAAISVAGEAGFVGSTTIFTLANSGINAEADDENLVELVIGAEQPQAVPDLELSEIFGTDFGTTLGTTITITPPTGVTFSDAGLTVTPATNHGISLTMGEVIITTTAVPGTEDTITVSGIEAVAGSTAASSLAVSIESDDGTGAGIAGVVDSSVAIGTTVSAGTVTLVGPEELANVGPDSAFGDVDDVDIVFTESTYGALNATADSSFIRVTPSEGVEIEDIFPDAGATSVVFGTATPSTEVPGSFVVPFTTESSEALDEDDDVHFTIDYGLDDATVGSTVTFTFSGSTTVAGSVDVATVVLGTVSSVDGAIPAAEPSAEQVDLAALEIEETFDAALSNGSFRILAPVGVAFESATVNLGGTPTAPFTTFRANDTITFNGLTVTTMEDTIEVSIVAFLGDEAAAGDLSFTIADGDTAGDNEMGITGDSVVLLYNGDVDTLDAGSSVNLSLGIPQTVTVEGGLDDITAESSDEDLFTVAISGRTITLTAVAEGNANLVVTDALGATDSVSVVVAEAVTPPALTSTTLSGETTTAVISGGLSTDGGSSIDDDGVAVGDSLSILVNIAPEEAHVGMEADIIIAVIDPSNGNLLLLTQTAGLVEPADPLQAFDTITLAASNAVNVLSAFTITEDLAGTTLDILAGYIIGSEVYYNSDPIELVIEAATTP